MRRNGRRFVITYKTTVLHTVQVANPALGRFDAWIQAWNKTLPPEYQGC